MSEQRRAVSNEEENREVPQNGKRRGNKTVLGTAVLLFLLAVAVLVTVEVVQRRSTGSDVLTVASTSEIEFYDADFDVDIFKDDAWLDEDRFIYYSNGIEGRVLSADSNENGVIEEMFVRFFTALMQGDDLTVNTLFTENYLNSNGKISEFTMQRVYDIRITLIDSSVMSTGVNAGKERARYYVDYCIMKNDGTFRRDIGSDRNGRQIFEVISDGEQAQINAVTRVQTGTIR